MLKTQGFQEHHIIPQKLKQHELFELSGLDIESRANKIFLPSHTSELFHGKSGRSQHSGRHNEKVFARMRETMNEAVEDGRTLGWTKKQYLQKHKEIIAEERQLLRAGQRKLNKHHREGAQMLGGVAAGIGVMGGSREVEARAQQQPLLFSKDNQPQLFIKDSLAQELQTITIVMPGGISEQTSPSSP